MSLRRVAHESVDFRRAEIAQIHLDQLFAAGFVDPHFVHALTAPPDEAADNGEGSLDKFTHGMSLTGRQHIIVRFWPLHHHPHPLDIVAGMAPIALGVQIADEKLLLMAGLYRRHLPGNFAGYEGLA